MKQKDEINVKIFSNIFFTMQDFSSMQKIEEKEEKENPIVKVQNENNLSKWIWKWKLEKGNNKEQKSRWNQKIKCLKKWENL